MSTRFYKCKWCSRFFDDRAEASRHAITCGMKYEITEEEEDSHVSEN